MKEVFPDKLCDFCTDKCIEACKQDDARTEPEFFMLNGELY